MNKLKRLIPVFMMLILMSAPVYGDDFQDANDAFIRKDYKTVYKLLLPLAEQGDVQGQYNLGAMYFKGDGVKQNFILAHMWFNLYGFNGQVDGVEKRSTIENKMSPSQIENAQEMEREWMEKHK
jgi:uncharacterized protein